MMMNEEDGNFNNNPTDGNQTSLLDDDEEQTQPPSPSPAIKKQTKGKTSLIAQATAMQKSRLIDDEFVKKKIIS